MASVRFRLAPSPLVLALCVVGCAEYRGGVVQVTIDTDAPVAGGGAVGAPPALFDRVVLEIYPPGASDPCVNCARIAVLDHAKLQDRAVSFGVNVDANQPGTRVRAVAYRADSFPDGMPTRRASLEVVAELPTVEDGEIREVTLFLPTDETGLPATSLADPRAVAEGRPATSRVATWEGARRIPCSGQPWPGQVCVPGGAAWIPAVFGENGDAFAPYDEQLVVLSPFFIDATETTVRDVLRSGLLTDSAAVPTWSGDEEGVEYAAFSDWHTYSGNRERLDLPVSPFRGSWARGYCQARGADLPSEAQVAYLVGGLASQRHPWGAEVRCEDAWLARVRFVLGAEEAVNAQFARLECSGPVGTFEPFRAVGTSLRDRVVVEGGTVEDVIGNAAELTRDRFWSADAPCWGEGVVRDPFCDPVDDPNAPWVVRGGSIGGSLQRASRFRAAFPPDAFGLAAGFRCARHGADSTPPPPELDVVLAQGCHEDADCGASPDARCLGPDGSSPAGGIVGGYCTRDCSTDDDCGPSGVCALGMCLARCDLYDPQMTHTDQPLLATKCHGRRDLICRTIDQISLSKGVCLGGCTSDDECGDRHCDRKMGGCVDAAPTGAPDGTPCQFHGQCKGWCVGAGTSSAFCASVCSAGGEIDSDDCGGSGEALCMAGGLNSPGSLGYCYASCETHDDCAPPSSFCMPVPFELPTGYELPPWWNVATAICHVAGPCTNVGQSCGSGLICADTPHGPHCLDPSVSWTQ